MINIKQVGMICEVDKSGRIVIPKRLRKLHNINKKDLLEIEIVSSNTIVIRKLKKES